MTNPEPIEDRIQKILDAEEVQRWDAVPDAWCDELLAECNSRLAPAPPMSQQLGALVACIRNAECNGRHDGLGEPVIGVDLYQRAALMACDEIEKLQEANDAAT